MSFCRVCGKSKGNLTGSGQVDGNIERIKMNTAKMMSYKK
jgi:hypothetical protein